MLAPDTDIQYVKGVGERRAVLFRKLKIFTLSDLVHFYPRDYLDLGDVNSIYEAYLKNECCFVEAVLNAAPEGYNIRKNLTVFKSIATDGADVLHLSFFNCKYLAERLKGGASYLFYGKVARKGSYYEMKVLNTKPSADKGKILPVYPLTAGLQNGTIVKVMEEGLSKYTPAYDTIPDKIREKYHLCTIGYALHSIHFPECVEDTERAKRRILFEQLLVFQLAMNKMKCREKGTTQYVIKKDYSDEFMSLLPFEMTNAQKNAVYDGIRDMGLNEPMNRLLQGDVGSGKTAVAAALIYSAVKNGLQAAFMAPTSILASQHYSTLTALFKETDIKTGLILGSTRAKEKREIKEKAESGEIDLLIGTHALIQSDISFKDLGLVITDEQHRFGVRQRASLAQKGKHPHTLVMSATPIPRTLGLIIYGDLSLSVLNEMPKGRQKISTYAVDCSYRERVYNYIKEHLDRGLQGYIVCPLVEESEAMGEVSSATQYFLSLQEGAFKDYKLGLLHGKMKSKEKEEVMLRFSEGEIQLLVSTTVIEVGIDVPNAVIMVIENAERFGLSTLHQLRGRVGRGTEKSSCILISNSSGETTMRRLSIMKKTNDGFKIADEDLKMRGPGDFFGERQHGLPEIKLSDALADMVIVTETREATDWILSEDPYLKKAENYPLSREADLLFQSENMMN